MCSTDDLPSTRSEGVTEDGAPGFGVRFEHPYMFLLINAQIKANLTNQMLVLGFNRLGQCNSDGFRLLQNLARTFPKIAAKRLFRGH